MQITYETIDKDTIKKITTKEEIIDLKKVREEISEIETQIANIPEQKTKPDQETLDMYNEHIGMNNKELLEAQIEEKRELLSQLEQLNG